MEAFWLFLILFINIGISIWNCYAVGTAWKEVQTHGGWFDKLLLYCGVTQSGIGFSMPMILILGYAALAYLTSGHPPHLSHAKAEIFLQAVFSMWYIAIILPALGSGFILTMYSLKVAYERRDAVSIGTAGWNTYAQVSNMIDAAHNLGGAFGNVGKLFGAAFDDDRDLKETVILLGLAVVAVALAAGFMIAIGLTRYFMRRSESSIERHFARA